MDRRTNHCITSAFLNYFLVGLASLTLSVLFGQGFIGSDDLGYSRFATDVLRHGLALKESSHHVGRIGVYLPLAVSFRIFGVNEFALTLIPVLSTVLTSVLLCAIGTHLFDARIGLFAGLLHAFFPLKLSCGNICVPEPMIGCEIAAAVLLFLKADPLRQGYWDGRKLLSGMLLGLAYLTSEVGAVMVPGILLYQFLSRKLRRGDSSFVLGFLCVLLGEAVFYADVYGHPLYRFKVLGGDYLGDPFVREANENLFDRLFKAYPRHFVYPYAGLGYYGPLLVISAVFGLIRYKSTLVLLVWAGSILFFYNFFSLKLTRYVALPAASRLIYPGCLPLLVVSAMVIGDFLKWGQERRSLSRIMLQGLCGCVVIWLCATSILSAYLTRDTGFTAILARNAEAAASYLRGQPGLTIVSDPRTISDIAFYRGFSPSDRLIDMGTSEPLETQLGEQEGRHEYIVINGPIYHLKKDVDFFPFDAQRSHRMAMVLASGVRPEFDYRLPRAPQFRSFMKIGVALGLLHRNTKRAYEKDILGAGAMGWVKVFPSAALKTAGEESAGTRGEGSVHVNPAARRSVGR